MKKIKNISIEQNIPKYKMVADYLKTKAKYKLNYNEYFDMYFYKFNENKRQEILTPNESAKLINQLNPFEKRYLIISKSEFNHRFEQYIKRDWLLLDEKNNEEFRLFIKSRDFIFVPALDNYSPEIIDITRSNEWQLHQELINTNHYIVEEVVKHHEKFNEITDQSLITLKFITLSHLNQISILGCYLNISINEEKYYILVDLNTGKTFNEAINNNKIVNNINNYQVKSFKIPLWKDTLKMVKELPKVITDLKYVSWEIAITSDGPLLISASDEPDYLILQHPLYLENHDGLLKQINDILKGDK